jgi:hypothetical protein
MESYFTPGKSRQILDVMEKYSSVNHDDPQNIPSPIPDFVFFHCFMGLEFS